MPTTFRIGDRVRMRDLPDFVVEVLEIGTCEDPACDLGRETFRFIDPDARASDWAHSAEFELA